MTMELVLLLFSAFATGTVLRHGYLRLMIDASGRTLLIDAVLMIAFLICLGLWLSSGARSAKRQFFVILIACLMVNVLLLARQWDVRRDSETPNKIHDGAIQTEEAARFLRRGINPYAADFRSTRFGFFPSPYGQSYPNVAWTHYVYPPANMSLAVPVVIAQDRGFAIDISLIYTAALWATVILLLTLVSSWDKRSRVVLLTLGNPLVWLTPVAGFNDGLYVFGIILALWADRRHRWIWSGLGMGLAVAAKQTAWLAVPIWLLWLWFRWRGGTLPSRALKKTLLSAIGLAAALYVPFIVWNLPALWDDLVRYPSGAIPFSYPISGSTLLQYLRIFGLIDNAWTTMPIWPIQVTVVAGLTWLAARWLRRGTHAVLLGAIIFVTLGNFLFSRYLLENYLQAILLLGIAGYAFHASTNES